MQMLRLILSLIFLWIQRTRGYSPRTDFDLKAHEKFSGRNYIIDAELNQNYVLAWSRHPFVDRMFLVVLQTLKEETLEDGSTRFLNHHRYWSLRRQQYCH
jgi:glycyl-tRNA synthetase (class II)